MMTEEEIKKISDSVSEFLEISKDLSEMLSRSIDRFSRNMEEALAIVERLSGEGEV